MTPLLANFFTSGHHRPAGDPLAQQLVFLNAINALGIFLIAFFAYLHWCAGATALAGFQVAVVGIAVVNVLWLRRNLNVERASRITLALLLLILIAVVLHGGFEQTGAFWVGLFPIACYFFKGSRRGSGWAAVLIFSLLGIALAQQLGLVTTPYSVTTLLLLVSSVATSSVLVHVYEGMREHQAMELIDLNRRLQEEARERRAAESALRHSDARLRHLAHHDQLTQLPNRVLLFDRLHHAMRVSDRTGQEVAVLFVDLDNFKPVNDELGHDCGDRLLIEAAGRLSAVLRASDTVARYGGDEFVILVMLPGGRESAFRVAEKILEALAQPFIIDGRSLQLGASLGLAFYPEHGRTVDSLIGHADAAMYVAKQQGKGRWSDQAKKWKAGGAFHQ